MSDGKSIEEMSFEEALKELDTIVKNLDTGNNDLDIAVKNFERGIALKKLCQKKLENAKLRIQQVTEEDNSSTNLKDLDDNNF